MDEGSNYLKLSFSHDGDPNDSFGRVDVEVRGDGFAGKGGMWVQWQDLLDLSEKLSAFPLPPDCPPTEDWGYGELEGYRSILRMVFMPVPLRGPIIVKVNIALDDDEEVEVRCKFRVDYPALEQFRLGLEKMASDKAGECLLVG